MNKEEKKFIKRIEDAFYEDRGKGIKHFQKVTLYEEGITDILKLLNFVEKQQKELEQKSETLDKVTDYAKMYIDDKQNEYEAISESYICQTDEDEYIKEKELAIIKGQKQVLKNVLNIIEGEK